MPPCSPDEEEEQFSLLPWLVSCLYVSLNTPSISFFFFLRVPITFLLNYFIPQIFMKLFTPLSGIFIGYGDMEVDIIP